MKRIHPLVNVALAALSLGIVFYRAANGDDAAREILNIFLGILLAVTVVGSVWLAVGHYGGDSR